MKPWQDSNYGDGNRLGMFAGKIEMNGKNVRVVFYRNGDVRVGCTIANIEVLRELVKRYEESYPHCPVPDEKVLQA